jgi:hypothetical protein
MLKNIFVGFFILVKGRVPDLKIGSFFGKLKTKVSIIAATALLLAVFPAGAIAVETPDATYTGGSNSAAVLSNLAYTDMQQKNLWSREAVFETSALGVMKSYDSRSFGRTAAVTKEEALAIAYRAAGREAEAQLAGEALNAVRTVANKKTNSQDVWYDGYLQLALNDGLITQQDYADAMNTDQTTLTADSFRRNGTAQRQEMAYWLAGTLKIQPVRGEQSVFSSYLDWKTAAPEKVPYIEAVLQNNIMSGSNSRFNPTGSLTREQAAQIVKNAEAQILPLLKMEKLTGTIEDISAASNNSGSTSVNETGFSVRNSNGKLHLITTQSSGNTGASVGEQGGNALAAKAKNLVVYKNNTLGDSSLLKKGDRIEYITNTTDNVVKYIKVISNTGEIRYVAAQVSSIDTGNLLLNVLQLFSVDYPDIKTLTQNVTFMSAKDAKAVTYRYSKSVAVTVDGKNAALSDIYPDMTVILAVMNNNVVSAIQTADFNINSGESRIVKGIVEENNPQLGYITLYNEDGTGTGKSASSRTALLRTYNYLNQNSVAALKNFKTADIEDIEAGDTVYLKLDDDGSVSSISAVDNYYVKYGKILSKAAGEIAVLYDDGIQQILSVDSKVLVIRDGKLDSLASLKDGDHVRLQLNISEKATTLKEITIEGEEHFISSIYKGDSFKFDDVTMRASVLNLQVLSRGKWERTAQKVFTGVSLAEDCKLYFNGSEIDLEDANRLVSGNQAYMAAEKDYGGGEKIVLISFRNDKDTEVLYSDNLAGVSAGSGSFSLEKEYKTVRYGDGSIIVKNSRLVVPGSLVNKDKAVVVANRDYTSGEFAAGVVKIDGQTDLITGQLYRARIKSINDNSDFTVESYSQLVGTDWVYSNTPKTFKMNFNTRLLNDEGVADIREFITYGDNSYRNYTVYILADDTNALLISTAPYGSYNARGTVYSVQGAEIGEEEGTLLQEPDEILLRNVTAYNSASYLWQDVSNMDLGLLPNSLIFKAGKAAKASDIKTGDVVRIIKKEAGDTGTAFIVIVE